VDIYLICVPVLALVLGVLLWFVRPRALAVAVPILLLWAGSKLVASWLNRLPLGGPKRVSAKDIVFLRRAAVRTWRYFAEFSTPEHNWLVPDNVQEEPVAIAARVSPTNAGLLLNAQQAACEFGYLTVPEFVTQSRRTLDTISRLKKYRGHLYNWYDTRTLEPLSPRFVSAVDSGNLLASLWTLQQGCLERLRQPVLQPCLAEGFLDYLRLLAASRLLPRKILAYFERQRGTDKWLSSILRLPERPFSASLDSSDVRGAAEARCVTAEANLRLQRIREAVQEYAPWLSTEYAAFRPDPAMSPWLLDTISLEQLPEFIEKLTTRVNWASHTGAEEHRRLSASFHQQLLAARENALRLIDELKDLAAKAGAMAEAMDFTFLVNRRRKLLSIGFDADRNCLEPACYDLLATESRTAVFVAIAKEDIPQESWFLLGRAHTLDAGNPVLVSWSGTAFEYLMPSLWMRSFPDTLLERSRVASVRSQMRYAERKQVPWGISEAAYSKRDEAGNYQYYAFGLPQLASRKSQINALVVSPYSTFLALSVDPAAALDNLRRMKTLGWLGGYGYYESADFHTGRRRRFRREGHQIVRCWMAHHQGMSLLALANFLNDNVVQRWFHAEPRVQASELLLHEKPVAHAKQLPRRSAVA